MAESKAIGQRSYRVATRRQSLSLPIMISIRLRRLQRRLSYLTVFFRFFRQGLHARIALSFNATWNQSVPVRGPRAASRHWQAAEQCSSADIVTHMASGDKEAERSALAVADGVELGFHAAFGATDWTSRAPF